MNSVTEDKEIDATQFKLWLISQPRRNRMKDLADDLRVDRTWPRGRKTIDALYAYMRSAGACIDALDTLKSALRAYVKAEPKTLGLPVATLAEAYAMVLDFHVFLSRLTQVLEALRLPPKDATDAACEAVRLFRVEIHRLYGIEGNEKDLPRWESLAYGKYPSARNTQLREWNDALKERIAKLALVQRDLESGYGERSAVAVAARKAHKAVLAAIWPY